MDRLSPEVVAHVEDCVQCHSEIVDLFEILNHTAERQSPVEVDQNKSRPTIVRQLYRLALVASVAGLAIFLFFRDSGDITPTTTSEIAKVSTDSLPEETSPSTPAFQTEKEISTEQKPPKKQQKPKDLYAANFIPSEDYEALIGTDLRSEALKISKPQPASHFKPEDLITFSWNFENFESLFVTVFNNREEIIARQENSDTTFSINSLSEPGLYYWQLENEAEILHVGKIFIDK